MEMCPTCQGAVAPGQPVCGLCGTTLVDLGVDPTRVQPGGLAPWPPGPGPVTSPLPAPPPGHGAVLPPGDGPVPPGYGPPVAYPAYVVPVPVYAPPKSKTAAALLCFFLGGLGIHRFYTGQIGLGLALLLTSLIAGPLTCGLWYIVTAVWVIVDLVLILCGSVRDQHGREMVW